MAEEQGQNDHTPPANQANLTPSPFNGVVPPVDHRWKPGQSGNPKGRTAAGATIREHINLMCEGDLTEKEIRLIARDKAQPWPRRTAAERILRTLEAGDLSDFAGLLRGENNFEDLRGMGINTEVVKRYRVKSRKVRATCGNVEEIIDREIELHDRAGQDFDRIVNQTAGHPAQPLEVDQTTRVEGDLTPQDLELIQRMRESSRRDDPQPPSQG